MNRNTKSKAEKARYIKEIQYNVTSGIFCTSPGLNTIYLDGCDWQCCNSPK